MYNLYNVLGVVKTASFSEIKKAFRQKIKEYHPDSGNEKNSSKFQEVMLSYEILGNDEKRAAYDSTGYVNDDDYNIKKLSYDGLCRLFRRVIDENSNNTSLDLKDLIVKIKLLIGSDIQSCKKRISISENKSKLIDRIRSKLVDDSKSILYEILDDEKQKYQFDIYQANLQLIVDNTMLKYLKDII